MIAQSKNVIVLLCVSIVVFVILFAAVGNVSAHESTDQEIILIHMTPKGFDPSEIEIKVDTTVTFENLDAVDRWPASNIHPSHGIYPEFDPKGNVLPGESWSFTFDKPGIWRFHDHLKPIFTGKISVQGTASETPKQEVKEKKGLWTTLRNALKRMFTKIALFVWNNGTPTTGVELDNKGTEKELPSEEDLDTAKEDTPPIANTLENTNLFIAAENPELLMGLLKKYGGEAVMADLVKDSGGGGIQDCHTQAHTIGRAAYKLQGAEVFGVPDAASCHSGFYHGAMESFLVEQGTENLPEKIEEVCRIFPTQFGVFECLHGVGHGVVAYVDYDLPEALSLCESLISDFDRLSCYGGAFMENVVAGQGAGALEGHETSWLSRDPHFPCNSIGGDYNKRYQCYQMQTSWMLDLMGGDYKKVGAECQRAPEDMVEVCFKSLGRDIAGRTLRDVNQIVTLCRAGETPELYRSCIWGATNVIVDFWGPKLEGQASALCALLTSDEDKRSCYGTLAGRLHDITSSAEQRKKLCETFEENYRSLCSS